MARPGQRRGGGVTVAQLRRALQRGEIKPVYLIVGEEAFLRRKAIDALIDAVAGDEPDDMAVDRLDGKAVGWPGIIDAARSLPLFLEVADGPARLLLVSPYEAGDKSDGDLLDEFLRDPAQATCLVVEAPTLDARRATAKALVRAAVKVQCDPPDREADVRRWIEHSAEARGFAIDPEAATYLLEMVGLDLNQLDQELGKVELFATPGARLAARDLESLMGRSREHSVFELTDALVAGRAEVALRVLNRLLDDGEEGVRILAMVSWVVRQLMTARDLSARGCPERQLLQQLGGRWNQRQRVLRKASRSDAAALERLLVNCSQSDATVKMQRGAGSRGALERLCRQVCSV